MSARQPSAPPATLSLLGILVLLSGSVAYLYLTCAGGEGGLSAGGGGASSSSSWASNGISESSSGTLFRAVRVRTYSGERAFATWSPPKGDGPVPRPKSGRMCKNWAVTTTIFPPTKTVNQIAALPDWCLVIAGDRKTPKQYNVSGGAVYLSPADQERMLLATGKLLRWNHFGRKNLGFLYAIQHGAKWVYDTDDDNELQSEAVGIPLPRPSALVDEVDTAHKLYNLYPQMSTVPSAWPRGFPLEAIKDNRTRNASFARRAWPARRVGVVQSLADHDPDVDGIYRLTQPLPFRFPPQSARAAAASPRALARKGSAMTTVAPRRGTMMPYNAQATLHAYDALWGLLLPCTVHGRVTDIWRAYFTQRLLWDIGSRIAFATPWVTQYRNAHNYLADFNSELPLYQQAGALVDALLAWRPASGTLPGRIEELYILMYECGIVGLADVHLAQAWLADLVKVGYRFPPLEAAAPPAGVGRAARGGAKLHAAKKG